MKQLITKMAIVALLVFFFTCGTLIAQSDDMVAVQPVMSEDLRVEVNTSKDVYHNRDVLRLTVSLLNNGPGPVQILLPIEPVPAEDLEEAEVDEVFEGVLDGTDVDVEIMPKRRTLIGYARLIPLGPSPLANTEQTPAPKRVFGLPLFGRPVVPAHSTRIISTANIYIMHPLLAESVEIDPNVVEPVDIDPNQVIDAQQIELIPAVGRYIALRPGYYLLDCRIRKIGGVRLAQAQKIIQIRPRIRKAVPVPYVKPLEQNTNILKKIDERTEEMANVDKDTNGFTQLNNRALKAIMKYIIRTKKTSAK